MKQYFVYFLTNKGNKVLYVGVTSNLEKRVWEHKMKVVAGFTEKYNVSRLVYFEQFDDPKNAIAREKQIKKWRRNKKDFLVNKMNAVWDDLSAEWYGGPSTLLGMTKDDAVLIEVSRSLGYARDDKRRVA